MDVQMPGPLMAGSLHQGRCLRQDRKRKAKKKVGPGYGEQGHQPKKIWYKEVGNKSICYKKESSEKEVDYKTRRPVS
jgi:hypothetical protein